MAKFTVEDLAQFAGTSVKYLGVIADRLPSGRDFQSFSHATRGGGTREIVAPAAPLDNITKNLYRNFVQEFSYSPPMHVHGFIKGRSTLTNAMEHLAKPCVLRVDLKEFFPSISFSRVQSSLAQQGLNPDAAEICSRIVTINSVLPIGLSTSPLLSNLVFYDTDVKLAEYSKIQGLSFTRYVDDLIFSGDVNDRQLLDIREILEEDGWSVNDRKVAFMRRGGPQYVTGLYVGCADRPRVPRAIKKQLRWVTHMIKTVGYEVYYEDFGGGESEMFPNRLLGWARYVASVEPEIGKPMLKFFLENIPANSYFGGFGSMDSPGIQGKSFSIGEYIRIHRDSLRRNE
ncbi:reverse transcriptase family protein [Saccharopolyspora sp. NFXS83]|uniref:reverse transcriptase family protein n=1 Tax=Saccharopolyspora sp. NFXS83 TaxID=2993560 RepID=UPI00224A947A|nr:reverse transcriptase family protein [Saccharopolyspora sp. NFXS83]MCX2733500.1 reverse transcriptase family protein [Saccharopolyspora sp. NFXS83]